MTKKKKALIVTARGGFIKAFLMHDISILQNLGYEVHCAANDNGKGYIEQYLRKYNVFFHQIDFNSKNPFTKDNFQAMKQIKKVFRDVNPNIIHCHTAISSAITRISLIKRNKSICKLIYTTHGLNFHEYSSRKSWILYYPIEKILSIWTDMIITINKEDYTNVKRMFCNKVRYINGVGVDFNKYDNVNVDICEYRKKLGVKKEDIFILSIGELSQRKNQETIIKAINKSNIKNVIFGICGTGIPGSSTYDSLIKLAEELDVKVKMFGFREDIPEICHCADFGVIPSTQEGLGLAGIEMLRSGLPILGSSVQGIKDYVKNGYNGFLYLPYDVEGFAEGIKKLSDKSFRNSMHLNCKDSVIDFGCLNSYEQMEKIYIEIENELNN